MLTALLVLLCLMIVNGVFAMSELAMMTARRSRLEQQAEGGDKGAAAALTLSSEPTRFLSTVQVGITLVGVFSGAFAEKSLSSRIESWIAGAPVIGEYSEGISFAIVVVGITYFSMVLGELVPKRIALAYPEFVASLIARPLALLGIVAAWPVKALSASTEFVVWALRIRPSTSDDVSEHDVRELVSRAASVGVFTPQEHRLMQRTMQVADLKVRDLMVPRKEVVWAPAEISMEELRVLVGTSPYSHFPVCRTSLDDLVGVVHLKDLISYGLLAGESFDIKAVARRPLFVPETMPALRLMEEFRRKRIHIAFVVDEYGASLGLLTLNDVLSALVGDLSRRGEVQMPTAVRRHDGSYLMDGLLPVREAMRLMGVADDEPVPFDASTVAGLVLGLMGRIPATGEQVEWKGWRIEVVDMDGSRIDQLLVSPAPPQPADPKAE